jgi:hypothetical protein
MELTYSNPPIAVSTRAVVIGFIAGFVAVLVFHQPVLGLLNASGFVHADTYSINATKPFGVPQVLSLAFWGGVWGILFSLAQTRFPRGAGYWVASFVFGAILPTLVAWFIVAALKGQPLAGGWESHRMITGLLINGAWGIGTALFLVGGSRMTRSHHG